MISFDCSLSRPGFRFQVAFEAHAGITALFGPSGSGKTTAIRLLAGLERPDRGRIVADGTVLLDTQARIDLPLHRRGIGLVFQEDLLLPHLSVRHNLTYGRVFSRRRDARIGFDPVVEMLGIGHLLDRRPQTLSGGERQRVAIGRALLAAPRLLLMDEPLASLDRPRKLEILPFIERLRDAFAIPVIYVSHAIGEVTRLASQVVRIEEGGVTAVGPPSTVLSAGAQGPVAGRFGLFSILSCRLARALPEHGVSVLSHPAGEVIVPALLAPGADEIAVSVRATDVTLARLPPDGISVRTILRGEIESIEAGPGPFALATIALPGGDRLAASLTRLAVDDLRLRTSEPIHALVKTVALDERGLRGFRRDDHA
jgi:molybdate transport system ATP-binding protein